ncbi:GNAT family N-acetyltransferase [Roseateles sp. SL47]|uniref:GNAT family N-acetyltransferase n=1 Tax=Roseateles sp. SL47 TaxID=2995138 RepID=UPI00226EDA8B|nr:GNAT family N-acetyltransferase [Roseateles sp. SL47]WAC73992.1 GNAT family N-acetyltransferase [Roseateles sp. SL47]
MPATLRQAAAHDADTLSALGIQVFLDTYATDGIRPDLAREALQEFSSAEWLDRLSQPQRRVVLAEVGRGLIGFAEVQLAPTPAPGTDTLGAELVRLYVQPAFQRSGVGTQLIAAAEQMAQSARLPSLWLTAWEGNHRALAFYARRGYADRGDTFYEIEGQRYVNRVLQRMLGSPPSLGSDGSTAHPAA